MQKAVNLQVTWTNLSKEIESWAQARFITRETLQVMEKHHRGLMNDLPNRGSHRVALSAIATTLFTERKITQGTSHRLLTLLEQFKEQQKPPIEEPEVPLQ